jgi:hypothetical protein
MSDTITAVFDGEVPRPESPVRLKRNARYRLTVEQEVPATVAKSSREALEALIGRVEAPEDWAAEHDHYLYCIPKRGEGSAA